MKKSVHLIASCSSSNSVNVDKTKLINAPLKLLVSVSALNMLEIHIVWFLYFRNSTSEGGTEKKLDNLNFFYVHIFVIDYFLLISIPTIFDNISKSKNFIIKQVSKIVCYFKLFCLVLSMYVLYL